MLRPSPKHSKQGTDEVKGATGTMSAKARLPQFPHSARALKEGTISNLSSLEKEKVSRLVQRLVTLGQEHELAVTKLKEEKDAFSDGTLRLQQLMEDQIATISNKLRSKDDQIIELEAKNSLSAGLLALYQTKLRNSADMFRFYELSASDSKVKTHQLESHIASLQTLVTSQKLAIESFEVSRARQAASMEELRAREETESAARHRRELRDMEERVAERDALIAALQGEVERLRALPYGQAEMFPKHANKSPASLATVEQRFVSSSSLKDIASVPTGSSSYPAQQVLQVTHSAEPPLQTFRQNAPTDTGDNNYDMYGPLYSSIDTSAISFSSSHHASSRHDLSALTDAAAGRAEGEERDESEVESEEESGALPHRKQAQSVGRGSSRPFESDSKQYASIVSEAARSALDPTPMKRRQSGGATRLGDALPPTVTTALHLDESLPQALSRTSTGPAGSKSFKSARSSSRTGRRFDRHNDEDTDRGADFSAPQHRVYSQTHSCTTFDETPESTGKKEKKAKKNGSASGSHHAPRMSDELTTTEHKRKVKSAGKPTGKALKEGAAVPSAANQRHRTFDASGPETVAPSRAPQSAPALVSTSDSCDRAAVRRKLASEAPSGAEARSRPQNRLSSASTSASTRPRDRTIVYDDSLFNLLSEI